MPTFPRDLIEPFRIKSGGLTLERQIVTAPTRGGLQQVAEVATPMWRARYVLPLLREADAEAWQAWLDSMRGGARSFKAYSPMRRYGRAYPAGYGGLTRHAGGAFDGTGTMTATISVYSIRVGSLPSTYQFSAGDLVSYAYGGKQFLHRVAEDATASAGVADITIEPAASAALAASGQAVQIEKAWCAASLDAKSVRAEWQPGRRCQIQFEANQTHA